jgi:glycosyltransferase involved in cell wall biosynthesis
MDKLVSIIIPVYNVKEYLTECIESVLNQSYKFIEIILIDDGSNDGSGDICDEYALKDKRIKVMHQQNAGVSAARNAGIDISTGEYIAFLDSDDTLDDNIIETAVQKASDDNTIYLWGYRLNKDGVISNGPELYVDNITQPEIIASVISLKSKERELGDYFRAVWGKLFYANIIKQNKIYFPENVYIGEDAIFLLKYSQFMTNVNIVSQIGYNYRIINCSAVRRYKKDFLEQSDKQMQEIIKITDSNDLLVQKSIFVFYYNTFASLLKNSFKGYDLKLLNKKEINHDAKVWHKIYSRYINKKKFDVAGLAKKHKFLYKYGKYLSFGLICFIIKYKLNKTD